jgi:hypothetical protein
MGILKDDREAVKWYQKNVIGGKVDKNFEETD